LTTMELAHPPLGHNDVGWTGKCQTGDKYEYLSCSYLIRTIKTFLFYFFFIYYSSSSFSRCSVHFPSSSSQPPCASFINKAGFHSPIFLHSSYTN
jgi:hypothetical protein